MGYGRAGHCRLAFANATVRFHGSGNRFRDHIAMTEWNADELITADSPSVAAATYGAVSLLKILIDGETPMIKWDKEALVTSDPPSLKLRRGSSAWRNYPGPRCA